MVEPLTGQCAAAWILAAGFLGACVGSFLNVVVYRLPRGLSVVYPGSHCPHCGRPIRWHDNIPVASWLVLRGRCRDCRGPISARYPLVEATVAATFVGVLWAEPRWSLAPPVDLPPAACLARAALGGYHLLMLCTLLAISLMELELDGAGPRRRPWSLVVGATLCGLLLPIAVVFAGRGIASRGAWPEPAGDLAWAWLVHAFAGMVAAAAAGFLIWPAAGLGSTRDKGRWTALAGLMLVGSFVGAGAVLTIACGAAAAWFVAVLVGRFGGGRARVPWTMSLFLAALAWLLLGPNLAGWSGIPSPGGIPGPDGLALLPAAGCLALLAGLSWATWALAGSRA